MSSKQRALAATVLLGVFLGSGIASAQAFTLDGRSGLTQVDPPPATDTEITKEGVKIKVTQRKKGRLDVIGRKGRVKPPTEVRPTDGEPVTARVLRKQLRLNIGICGLARDPEDGGRIGPARCGPRPEPEVPEETVRPTVGVRPVQPGDVTWEQVLAAAKDVAFPGRAVKVQPAGRTLVNLETIVYTEQTGVSTARVTLLGFPVDVEAMPVSYTWNFGDGTTVTTTTPGRPYPAKDVVHKYTKRAALTVRLTTNYGARYNVAGTGWQYVDGTVPITGPGTPLLVREAVPVLVDPPN